MLKQPTATDYINESGFNMSFCVKKILITMSILFIFVTNMNAQESERETYTFEFRGADLRDALETVADVAGLDLIYDPDLVRTVTVHKRIQSLAMPELLLKLLEDSQLDFITLSTGTIVIIKTVRDEPSYGSYAGKVVDAQTGEPLPGANVMLADASGGTSTNRTGNFSLNSLISGTYNIIFS